MHAQHVGELCDARFVFFTRTDLCFFVFVIHLSGALLRTVPVPGFFDRRWRRQSLLVFLRCCDCDLSSHTLLILFTPFRRAKSLLATLQFRLFLVRVLCSDWLACLASPSKCIECIFFCVYCA
jgi:hypothetical protein